MRRPGHLISGLGPASVGTSRIPDKSGQARGLRIVVGAESFVADVHLCQAAVDLVAALVEPAADVPAVGLGCAMASSLSGARPASNAAVRRARISSSSALSLCQSSLS